MPSLRLAFLGSPPFAVPALDALHAAGHEILAVYTQPPRPAGRGHRVTRSAVHARADALGLAVRYPARLRGDETEWASFAALGLDAAVVAAYGLILPPAMLGAPRRGCLNIHASLLPRWRGAAPIQAALLAGDQDTGVTIMRMDEGLDTGPTLLREAVPIGPRDITPVLYDLLALTGARLMLRTLDEEPEAIRQPACGATYAPKLGRDDGRIDWTRPADAIDRQVRALTPWPGTFTMLDGATLKILEAEPVRDGTPAQPPGTVLDDRFTVSCGAGALRIGVAQLPGRPAAETENFLLGHPVPAGTMLGGSS